ncbi:hypothetical protein BTW10_03950 [Chromohalobacter japonicus]|uniref:Uncharacterized protein n=1 Tax=Chromohalobacter japonicus TaxID=223900 RepID=A0A1Q8TG39_9GAMM|nr:hypothetical protein [Chromohalobacter japonicus]OLO12625.1 hypothetical protein BTW10_03950 [Chromohalobacter japonicus]
MPLTNNKRAVDLFEEAFDRLRHGKPINIPAGSEVTQNNVAREAGRDPSALRSDRYPELLQRIKSYIASERDKVKTKKESSKKRNRPIEERLADCMRQRDRLQSICHSQQTLIDELLDEIEQLEKGNIIKIRNRDT